MANAMDAEGFGGCTNHEECEAACPKGISVNSIARFNRDFLRASLLPPPAPKESAGGSG
jgi:succinate dehydrogenase / fumarate reductase iron-sulfur subunit